MPIKTFFITAANIQKIIEKQKHAPKSFAKDTVLNGKTVSLGHFLVRKIKIIFGENLKTAYMPTQKSLKV